MLTLSQVGKSYGGRTLFSDVSLQVNRAERIGLVGPNGAGKSTLFSLILKESAPDDGSVILQKGATLGFLPQESAPSGEETVLELATAVTPEFAELQRRLKDDDDHEAHARFDELGGFQLEPKAKRILSGLAFRESDFHRPARTMSGGWVMRAHLARLLVQEPDLLMLDEPTNHLDLESLVWFQNYLRSYPGAILMISHDREFLNALVDSIIDIHQRRIHRYRGNYDDYLAQRAAREEQHLAAYKNQQREIQSLQEFADRFRAKASKASQAQSKLKQIDRMDKIEAPVSEDRKIKFRFPQPPRSGTKVISLKDIHHAYGDHVVYTGIDFEAERGQRTVLVGPNGAGKSTLLKILGGVIPFQSGTREPGHNVKVGYYAQYRVEMLNTSRTVLQEVLDSPNPVSEQTARTVLGSFLFRQDDVFKNVGVLSGGEKSRLALVKLLLDPPNLLLMDEPTTHLDMASIDALIGALQQYEGTLIFISHDVYFIRALASTVLHINAGRLTPYPGDYQYYLDKSKAVSERAALTAGDRPVVEQRTATVPSAAPTPRKTKEQKRQEAEERNERSRARKEHQHKVATIEVRIASLELQQKKLVAQLEDPATYASPGTGFELNRELLGVGELLERLTREWEALAETESAG
jgi:ATP-binding cassette subfamily F protein 3